MDEEEEYVSPSVHEGSAAERAALAMPEGSKRETDISALRSSQNYS